MRSDEELLLDLADGDLNAMEPLFNRNSGRVRAMARKKGLSEERAEDLVQIVFMQIFRKKHLYKSQYKALAWIYVITKSEIKDYRNRELKKALQTDLDFDKILSQTPDLNPSNDQSNSQSSSLSDFTELLSPLNQKEQEAVRLRYQEELEFAEIAERLNKSESNIRKIISRSLRKLKDLAAKERSR